MGNFLEAKNTKEKKTRKLGECCLESVTPMVIPSPSLFDSYSLPIFFFAPLSPVLQAFWIQRSWDKAPCPQGGQNPVLDGHYRSRRSNFRRSYSGLHTGIYLCVELGKALLKVTHCLWGIVVRWTLMPSWVTAAVGLILCQVLETTVALQMDYRDRTQRYLVNIFSRLGSCKDRENFF